MVRWSTCFALLTALSWSTPVHARDDDEPQPRGLVQRATPRPATYTLFSPFRGDGWTYLVDDLGRPVHTWKSAYRPGLAPYLLPNGDLLRGIQIEVDVPFTGGGQAGGLQRFTWDGQLEWEWHLANDLARHHHDIAPLPNGNVLVLAWERKSRDELIAAGRPEEWAGDDGLWPGMILEVEPLPPFGARVVWEWHAWDHLVQDKDETKPHYGVPFDHPGRIDINCGVSSGPTAEERAQLAALGYLDDEEDEADEDEMDRIRRADWMHANGIDYHAGLDQIVISLWHMSEVWVIDHGTTTEEAASSSGGKRGRGGDLLYRWGNPQMWGAGDDSARQLFHQHDPQWIPEGSPGAGHLTVFDNGRDRPGGDNSRVVELVTPLQEDGTYTLEDGEPYGPATPHWTYHPTGDDEFYASFISGAHRLANGHTLVTSGPDGMLREVDEDGATAWEYHNPYCVPSGPAPLHAREYSLFRATRIASDHPALAGRTLEPLDPPPPTGAELAAERTTAPDANLGWQPLFLAESWPQGWVNVNCAPDETFQLRPDPDDDEVAMLVCSGKPTGLLRSETMFENFILEFEWRHMDERGNAGFFVWADPLPAVGGPFTRGIEVQVCNLGNGSWFTSHGDIFPIWGSTMTPDPAFRISGSRSMPNEDAFHANPTGEWNRYRITALDGAITLEVNGHHVTGGAHCNPRKGYLCFESEGGEVHFRRGRIWELPAGSRAAEAHETATEARPFTTLYNGLDLDAFTLETGTWTANDWRITASASASMTIPLPEETEELFFDFRRPAPDVGDEVSTHLPFRLGSVHPSSAGETPGAWCRVHAVWVDGQLQVTCGDTTTTVPTAPNAETLTLVTNHASTEFCSLFVRTR